MKNLPEATLVYRKDYTPELMVVRFGTEEKLGFKPGQYCTIGLKGIERAYSIASAPHEEELELFVELVPEPEGQLTPLLWRLPMGGKVSLRPRCKGIFTLDQKYTSHLMIATVTGVAPYISMLRDHFHYARSGHKFYVLLGSSYKDELVYDAELEEISKSHLDEVAFVPTVSRPGEHRNEGWKGCTGRVNEIAQDYAKEMGLNPQETLVYACGHPGMIEDIKARFLPGGWVVREERFWKQ